MIEQAHQNEYVPSDVLPPGETLLEILEDRGLSQAMLAERMGRPKKTVNEIVKGKAMITPVTAIQLSRVLGTSSVFWLNLESNFRAYLAEQEDAKRIEKDHSWVRNFPISKLVEYGWVKPGISRSDSVKSLLSFFAIASPDQWRTIYKDPQATFRRSMSFESNPGSLSCWLRRGTILSESIECSEFSKPIFKESLERVRALTREPIEDSIPRLIRLCAHAGVAVVFVRQLPKSPVSGASYWTSPNLATIQLSFRYKSDDHLWFAFFHEAGHILLHGKKQVFLEGDSEQREGPEEDEANRFAADFLVPRSQLKRLERSRTITRAKVLHFAESIGVSPGIVVGRLQHDGMLRHTHLNDLKVKYDWSRIETSPEG